MSYVWRLQLILIPTYRTALGGRHSPVLPFLATNLSDLVLLSMHSPLWGRRAAMRRFTSFTDDQYRLILAYVQNHSKDLNTSDGAVE